MKKYLLIFLILSKMSWAGVCDSKLFSFSTPDDVRISVSSLLREITLNSCNVNIVFDDMLAKKKFNELKVSRIYVKNYNFSQVLDLLVANNNFFYEIKNNVLHIGYVKTKTFNIDYIPSDRDGESSFAPSNVSSSDSSDSSDSSSSSDTNTINSHYIFDFWSKLANNLNNILNSYKGEYNSPTPIIDRNTGLVTVTATKRQLLKIEEYINKINERLHKQIMIDVRIYEVHLSKSNQTGVNWSKLGLSLGSPNAGLSAPVNITGVDSIIHKTLFNAAGLLNFLASQGNVNSLSNPKLAALNNQKAIISVGDTVNYRTLAKASYTDKDGNVQPAEYSNKSKFIGILLDITPEISEKDGIILRINPTVSSFKDESQLLDIKNGTRDFPPDTSENKLSTVVRINDGDTLVLGGLITNKNAFQRNGVPVLKEIPVVKYLFSSKSKISDKVELVFVVTPHIVRENKRVTIKELGY